MNGTPAPGKDDRKLAGFRDANSPAPRSRTLQAGGEFLKALASDLAAVASWLRLSLIARDRRTPPPRASAPNRISAGRAAGRVLWRVSIVLLGLGSICAGALCGIMLWVLYGFPFEPRQSAADPAGLQLEAAKNEPRGRIDPGTAAPASRQDVERQPASQVRPGGEVTAPSTVASGTSPPAQSGTSSPDAAKQTQTDAQAGSEQLPALLPQAGQQEISRTLTASPAPMRCSVGLCAARYRSFNAADCTYQPYGGGPRSFCELSTQSADASPQTARAATDPSSEAKNTPIAGPIAGGAEEAAKSAPPARAGAQCNLTACAATYRSFHAADCTYQPHGGGPRSLCQLSSRSADAPPPISSAMTDSRSEATETPIAARAE